MTTCAQKPDGEERGGVRVAVGNKMSIFSPAMLVNVFVGCWFLILPLRGAGSIPAVFPVRAVLSGKWEAGYSGKYGQLGMFHII